MGTLMKALCRFVEKECVRTPEINVSTTVVVIECHDSRPPKHRLIDLGNYSIPRCSMAFKAVKKSTAKLMTRRIKHHSRIRRRFSRRRTRDGFDNPRKPATIMTYNNIRYEYGMVQILTAVTRILIHSP
jgi:hypothetical protein